MRIFWESALSWLFFTASLAFLALAGYCGYCYFSCSGELAVVADTDILVTDAAAGETREVVLRLTNSSGRPLRILGLAFC
jgi:hypothetical protein